LPSTVRRELNDRLLTSLASIHRYFRPEALKQIMIGTIWSPLT
jgi:hypothetical protein